MTIDRDMEEWRAKVESQQLFWRAGVDAWLHADRGAVDIGIEVLRNAILLNGGAAVALLAFTAELWKDNGRSAALTKLACTIFYFAWGAISSGIASGVAYLYQSFMAEHARLRIGKDEDFKMPNWLVTCRYITVTLMTLFAVIAYGLFVTGALTARYAFAS